MGDVTLKRTGVFGLWKSKNATVNWRGRMFKVGALLKIVSVEMTDELPWATSL